MCLSLKDISRALLSLKETKRKKSVDTGTDQDVKTRMKPIASTPPRSLN